MTFQYPDKKSEVLFTTTHLDETTTPQINRTEFYKITCSQECDNQ